MRRVSTPPTFAEPRPQALYGQTYVSAPVVAPPPPPPPPLLSEFYFHTQNGEP